MRLTVRVPIRGHDGGSALILVPAGFLVLMVLAAIAVDSAAAYLGQRQLTDAVSAAANDAATAAIADFAFYGAGRLQIDPQRAAMTVCSTVSAQVDRDLHDLRLEMAVAPSEIEVRATATVNAVFGGMVPGFARRQVRAEAFAIPAQHPHDQTLFTATLVPIIC